MFVISPGIATPKIFCRRQRLGYSAEAQQFFDRITDPGTTRKDVYAAMIDGLVTDGIWTKFDALWILAADIAGNALVNLKSSSFGLTAVNSPTFTADRGYTGASTKSLDTAFNPTTATSPKFTQNDAHLSAWSLTSGNEDASVIGTVTATESSIYPKFVDSNTYMRANDAGGTVSTTPDGTGFYLTSRTGASAIDFYWNNSALTSKTTASGAVANSTWSILKSTGYFNSLRQIAMASAGGKLTSTEAGNFYSRVRTYMTAVGVP